MPRPAGLNAKHKKFKAAGAAWWYIYKPASSLGSYLKSGRNFSYITPDSVGRWNPSNRYINSNSMLLHTLSPLFRPTYTDYLAVLVYTERRPRGKSRGSAAQGIMMADNMGGIWIGHTIPGYPDLSMDRPSFPEKENHYGHMMMCLSIDLVTLNKFAAAIRKTGPKIMKLQIPKIVRRLLPEWERMNASDSSSNRNDKSPFLTFKTRDNRLRGVLLPRRPGDTQCIYRKFAKKMGIILDVYGHTEHKKNICRKKFSVRNIDEISLKYRKQIYYIDQKTDVAGFAVSAESIRHRLGKNSPQYWTCTGNVESHRKNGISGQGGTVICIDHYDVWTTFDTLKIKEPEC